MSELIEWAEFGEDKCIRRKKNKTQRVRPIIQFLD